MASRGKIVSKERYSPLRETAADVSRAYVKNRYVQSLFRDLEIKIGQPTRLVELTEARKQRYEEGTGKIATRSVAVKAQAAAPQRGGKAVRETRDKDGNGDFAPPPPRSNLTAENTLGYTRWAWLEFVAG